jgi:RNA recognition motif-containing protein
LLFSTERLRAKREGRLAHCGEAFEAPEESLMGRRLYVGNLAWTVTDQDLQDAFSEAGQVDSSQVIMDRATNRSRGFGFVEMATDEAADAAVKKLNGRDIKGRPIRVNEAQARGTGSGGGRGAGSGRDR